MPNFKGFFLGDFISERMRFSTTLEIASGYRGVVAVGYVEKSNN
jgi:hypothetical protein